MEARENLAISYGKLGDINKAEGDLAAAKDFYLQSLELSRQLFEETRMVLPHQDFAVSYSRLGDISRDEGDLAAAKDYYLKDLELSRQLFEETGTAKSRRGLSISYDTYILHSPLHNPNHGESLNYQDTACPACLEQCGLQLM